MQAWREELARSTRESCSAKRTRQTRSDQTDQGDQTEQPVVFARLMAGQWKKGAIPPLWDGKAAERIVEHLEEVPART